MEGQLEVALPRDHSSAARARYLVAELSAATLDRDELERAKLLVSELVTNALVHGRGAISLRASLDAERLLVEVIDEGSGFERAPQHDRDELGGLGLGVVDAEASRWGVHAGTTHVWFELDLTSGPYR
jgi:anti-sigma regulatory factor (Ser/Thr protein kinase)